MTFHPLLRRLTWLLPVAAVLLAGHALRDLPVVDVLAAVRSLPPERWAAAGVATALSFAALAGYEWLAVAAVGVDLPPRTVVRTGLVAWAVGQALGPAWLSGGAVRLRMYGREGVPAGAVARIVAANVVTFWVSLVALLGLALVATPAWKAGLVALGLVVGGFAAVARWPGRFGGLTARRLAAQLAVGIVDAVAAVAALAACLPELPSSFPKLVASFAAANVGGLLSGVPAGLGALEAGLVALLPDADPAHVVAGVLAWRAVYLGGPLAVAVCVLIADELRSREAVLDAVPGVLAATAFLSGSGLLVSAFAPGAPAVVGWLGAPLPDEWLAASHAATAAVGVGLWFVARGLWGRTREAWATLLALWVAGAVASLLRGGDPGGAVALSLAALAWPARRAFWRRAALGHEAWSVRTWSPS